MTVAGPVDHTGWSARAPVPACGQEHRAGPGRFDEAARRVRHEELAVAELLVGEGHDVVALPERRGAGPVADFEVCGMPVEVKCLQPREQRRDARPANERSVCNALRRGVDQAGVTVLVTQGSGLRAADAAAGMHRFARSGLTGRTRAVRIVGDGFDVAWVAGRDVGARRERPAVGSGEKRRERLPPGGGAPGGGLQVPG